MPDVPFRYSARIRRPPLELPGGARVAFYVAPNVEHFAVDRPGMSLFDVTSQLVPDPLNYGWRDYGVRVGIWRLADVLSTRGVRPSVAINSAVCRLYPEIVEEGRARDWTWIAHGRDNSTLQTGMDPAAERAYLTEVVGEIEEATGTRPRGWLGPALTETFQTPELLAELGLSYVLDWANDDEPYPLEVTRGQMLSVPYLLEPGDIPIFLMHGGSEDDFARAVIAHFDRLHREGAQRPSIMGLALHPFLIGQPARIGGLERALDHILSAGDVWVTTSDEIAAWYLDRHSVD